jgi:hypothetical protein
LQPRQCRLLLQLAPGQVSGTLQLLLTMRWEPGQLLQLVRSHERLLTVPAATLGTRFAFLVSQQQVVAA